MRSRAPLALLEQLLMLLVFAIAAVTCLRAFVWSDSVSRSGASRDEALTMAQSAAEVLKSNRGDLHGTAAMLGGAVADGKWVIEVQDFTLTAAITQRTPYWGQAAVTITAAGKEDGILTVAWQEVVP